MKDSLAERLGYGGGAVGDLELLVDVLQVGLDGRRAQEQESGDLRARTALSGQGEDLALAAAEPRAVVMAVGSDLRGQAVVDVRREIAPAPGDRGDGVADDLALGVLGHIAVRSRGGGLVDER